MSSDFSKREASPFQSGGGPVPRRVLLLPGIWMPAWSLRVLGHRLTGQGFSVRTLAYPGVRGGPGPSLRHLLPALREVDAVVCHSLGGLMVVEALRAEPSLPVRRVVCLGSPLQGSAVARALHRRRLGSLLGRSSDLLATGCALPWPGRAEVGMVAGATARGVGVLLNALPDPGDGTVAIEETRWPGLSDHVVVKASHSGLVCSSAAAGEVAHFLRHGRFRAGGATAAHVPTGAAD